MSVCARLLLRTVYASLREDLPNDQCENRPLGMRGWSLSSRGEPPGWLWPLRRTIMTVFQDSLEVRTAPDSFTDITERVRQVVSRSGVTTGLCTVFVQHTSASLVIQENADPAVLRDLSRWMSELAPQSRRWEHDAEGPDDMPAHARSALTRTSEVVPVSRGRLGLGTWQAIYLWEHRAHRHSRTVVVHVAGE